MTKRWKGRLLGAVAAGALAASMVPAMALGVGASVLDSTATDADPAGPGYSLTLSGLEQGDTAKYYKIIRQDVDTVDTQGNVTTVGSQAWMLTTAVDANEDGIVDGTEAIDFGHKTPGPDGQLGTDDDVSATGLYVDELVISTYTDDGDEVTSDTRQLTPAMVNALATAVTNNAANGLASASADLVADENGVIEVSGADSGLYMFVAVPNASATPKADYLYKPIFVSADYYNSVSKPEDNTHQIAVMTVDGDTVTYADYATDAGVFKRSPLQIDKKSGTYDEDGNPIDLQQDVAVGDTVNFEITVPVPTYTSNYVAPQFYITDVLTEGLKLVPNTITVEVKNGSSDVSVTENKDFKVFTKTDANPSEEFKAFNNVATGTFDGFVVQFLNDDPTTEDVKNDGFLRTVLGAPTCTIKYQAVVTETDKQKFAQQINQMDNTAKLNYSNDPNYIPDGYFKENPDNPDEKIPNPDYPTDTPDPDEPTSVLQDRTRHYTFDIDADVLGRDQSGDVGPDDEPLDESDHDKTSEIRKIWVDANGHVIQEKATGDVVKGGGEQDGKEGEYGWLEGAEFTLTKTKAHVTTGVGTEAFEELGTPVQMKFDATSHILKAEDGVNPTSDAKGYIAMKGLDAGVYILKEIKAPLGYAFNPNIQYEITITPTYVMEPPTPTAGTTPEDGKGGADDLILESYEIKIVTQKLDDSMNIISGESVETISTYNVKKDANDQPMSTLNEDGTQDTTVTIDKTVQSFGNNETAMIMNKKLGLLPATGGSGIFFYLFVGGAIALVSYILIRKLKKASKPAA